MAKRTVPKQYLTIASFYPKWQRAFASARRVIADVEAGDEDWMAIKRAKDRLYKLVGEAAGHAPLSYKDPAVEALLNEISTLPSIEDATRRGGEARQTKWSAEMKRLREEEREAQRPHEWLRR